MPALTKPKDRRCVVVNTRVTEHEAEVLAAKAEQEAMTLSDFVRARLFPQRVAREKIAEPPVSVNVNIL